MQLLRSQWLSSEVTTGSQNTQTESHQVVLLPIQTHTPTARTDITDTSNQYLLVFGSEGWRFESVRARLSS
jgi:hypothetical protein